MYGGLNPGPQRALQGRQLHWLVCGGSKIGCAGLRPGASTRPGSSQGAAIYCLESPYAILDICWEKGISSGTPWIVSLGKLSRRRSRDACRPPCLALERSCNRVGTCFKVPTKDFRMVARYSSMHRSMPRCAAPGLPFPFCRERTGWSWAAPSVFPSRFGSRTSCMCRSSRF
jgi:hypothetical protein